MFAKIVFLEIQCCKFPWTPIIAVLTTWEKASYKEELWIGLLKCDRILKEHVTQSKSMLQRWTVATSESRDLGWRQLLILIGTYVTPLPWLITITRAGQIVSQLHCPRPGLRIVLSNRLLVLPPPTSHPFPPKFTLLARNRVFSGRCVYFSAAPRVLPDVNWLLYYRGRCCLLPWNSCDQTG